MPARIAPNMISTNSTRLLIDIAKRSPGLMPSRASVEATRSSRDSKLGVGHLARRVARQIEDRDLVEDSVAAAAAFQ